MSGTRVAVLTPVGAGAIATVAVEGPGAWSAARSLFRPAGKSPLPDTLKLHRFWYGTLGGDEVVLAVTRTDPEPRVEVHCHGGRRVVRWVVEQFVGQGCVEDANPIRCHGLAFEALTRAPTLRTASILLDQHHGAFEDAVRGVLERLAAGDTATAAERVYYIRRSAPLGRHLVQPWKVVVAGPPNVGKSSLVNALAGYQRSVVSDVAGTTRDVVTTAVAFDGWPVELADTAGLRRAAESLEAAGIDHARRFLAEADLIVWVLDNSSAEPVWAEPEEFGGRPTIAVVNKSDLPAPGDRSLTWGDAWDLRLVSARTGAGIPGLVAEIAHRLVPEPPQPGAAVPFTPALVDAVDAAHAELAAGRVAEAVAILRAALPPA